MRVRDDLFGIEGFPLRMMIILVIIILSFPVVFNYYENYDVSSTQDKLSSEVNKVENAIKHVYIGGPGNSRILSLDISNGVFAKVDYIKIGDDVGGDHLTVISYKLKDHPIQRVLFEDPQIYVTGLEDGELMLSTGQYELNVKCMNDKDVTGDENNDIYVSVRVL